MTVVTNQEIFATAPTVNGILASAPDSITIGGGSIWVEYGDGASSTGGGASTIVQYSISADGMTGTVENTYADGSGLADGLKYDPATGLVWVLNNNDANANLLFINPTTNQMSAPLTYGGLYPSESSTRGFDDVAFDGKQVFLSETNPNTATSGDPVIVELQNGQAPFGPNFGMHRTLQTKSILSYGATGTDLNTGQTNQLLPMTDPDSLKLLPNGDLLLTGEADGAYIFVQNPGTPHQTQSFVTLPTGYVPDDAIMPTSTSGTFYISNQGGNDIISVQVTGLITTDLYADITTAPNAPDGELVQIDPSTGAVTPVTGIKGLNNPHGLAFVPSGSGAVAGDPPASSLSVNNAITTTTGVQNPGLDHAVALFNQSMAASFPEQPGGQITTNALPQIATNEEHFLAQPHHG
jgi:hypothetical protein